jgi:hypothetical protein
MKSQVKKILNNQAIGLLPLLLSMILDLYVSYVVSFLIGAGLTLLLLTFFHTLAKKGIYQFLLVPVLATYVCYSVFLFFNIEATLNIYSPIIAEVLLVSILGFTGFFKRSVLQRVRYLPYPHQALFRSTLSEAFFVGEIVQTLYTLYLFVILLYSHLPESSPADAGLVRIFYHYVGALIGLLIISYEQIRLHLIHRTLKNGIWLPVLNAKRRVVGSAPFSAGQGLRRKYYHPVVRIVVVYKGMLYLEKRAKDEIVSPELLDHPFHRYVIYQHTKESTALEIMGKLKEDETIKPHLLIHYTFENEKVKQLVSLYAILLHSEEQLRYFTQGKLWTPRQIEANLEARIFSEYFYKEFLYLQNTVLLAESI